MREKSYGKTNKKTVYMYINVLNIMKVTLGRDEHTHTRTKKKKDVQLVAETLSGESVEPYAVVSRNERRRGS